MTISIEMSAIKTSINRTIAPAIRRKLLFATIGLFAMALYGCGDKAAPVSQKQSPGKESNAAPTQAASPAQSSTRRTLTSKEGVEIAWTGNELSISNCGYGDLSAYSPPERIDCIVTNVTARPIAMYEYGYKSYDNSGLKLGEYGIGEKFSPNEETKVSLSGVKGATKIEIFKK